MNYIFIGDIVNTHGVKGEVRLVSNFERKDLVFKENFNIYVGSNKEKLTINTYRVHKNFDMLTFKEITDINDVIIYKGEKVYILREQLSNEITLKTDLIGYDVIYNNKNIGKVVYFFSNNVYDIMAIKNEKKENFVPYLDKFIQKIDSENKKIYVLNMDGLIDED